MADEPLNKKPRYDEGKKQTLLGKERKKERQTDRHSQAEERKRKRTGKKGGTKKTSCKQQAQIGDQFPFHSQYILCSKCER